MNKLHVDSVTKSYGSKHILQDIYLGCETGKIVGLLGRNGAGKSTLLQIIFGTIKGKTQFIRFNDIILKNQFDRRNRIAYLPQHPFLPKNMNVKTLIDLFCGKEEADELLKVSLIRPFLDHTVGKLSGGEQRMVETLLIIYSESAFILLDEPFHSLSPKIAGELKILIRERSKQKGFIISDHSYRDVLDLSDDVCLLSDTHLKRIKDFKELEMYNYLPKTF
ncbi:ATP-binding cassette domain-containing protein [Chryseobacterium gossypii]|uniref:ATP-binding cassette domain-containing protein n=1 Tax=Chryseobacterium gossypii TaxID=3231602 RepID=UPI003526BE4E